MNTHKCKTPTAFKRDVKMMNITAKAMTTSLQFVSYITFGEGLDVAFFHKREVVTLKGISYDGKRSDRAVALAAVADYKATH